jgi:Flp pilus assembly protein TadD
MVFVRAITVVALCLWGIAHNGRAGLSRLYSAHSLATGSLTSADDAVRYGPSDPEAFYARAMIHQRVAQQTDAIRDLESATELRRHDYLLWLELGRARQLVDDTDGARLAFQESVRLAPYSVQPRWQLGNLLLRAGRTNEAFAELRRAAAGDPDLLPIVFDLAWNAYRGNAGAVEQAIKLERPRDKIALAYFLLKHGNPAEAVALFRSTENVTAAQTSELTAALLATKRFYEAYEVWSGKAYQEGLGALTNGGFEQQIATGDAGFGWQLTDRQEAVRAALDTSETRAGKQSLLLEFSGLSNPGSPLLSQLILVEADTTYQLRFAARTRKLVAGGLPVVVIADVDTKDGSVLGQSAPILGSSDEWHDYNLSFKTGKTTTAMRITVQRQSCGQQPCPALGRLWLDDFSLRKL